MSFTQSLIVAALVLAIIIPLGTSYLGGKKPRRFKRSIFANLITFSAAFVLATVFVFTNNVHAATEVMSDSSGLAFIGAAISTGLGSLGAGLATGQAASAALGALSENEGVMGKAIVFVGLAEGIAIYGLIISIMILNKV